MKNNETNKSKGYGFIEFKNYIEYKHALDNTEPLILRKKKLIFNAAKNKYDNFNQFFAYNIMNNNENKIYYNKYNDYNFYKVNKENINNNIINPIYKERKNKFELVYKNVNNEIKENTNNNVISNFHKERQNKFELIYKNVNPEIKENINNNIINPIHKERKNKFELVYKNVTHEIKEKINIKNYSINEQIKYSLEYLSKNYSKNDNFLKSKICAYYCSPFLDKNIFSINKNSFAEK